MVGRGELFLLRIPAWGRPTFSSEAPLVEGLLWLLLKLPGNLQLRRESPSSSAQFSLGLSNKQEMGGEGQAAQHYL